MAAHFDRRTPSVINLSATCCSHFDLLAATIGLPITYTAWNISRAEPDANGVPADEPQGVSPRFSASVVIDTHPH